VKVEGKEIICCIIYGLYTQIYAFASRMPSAFPIKISVGISHDIHACYISHSYHLPSFRHPEVNKLAGSSLRSFHSALLRQITEFSAKFFGTLYKISFSQSLYQCSDGKLQSTSFIIIIIIIIIINCKWVFTRWQWYNNKTTDK
jgi:hypothetical protein